MKKFLSLCLGLLSFAAAAQVSVSGPDGRLTVTVSQDARYSVTYDGRTVLEPSRLGLRTDIADFTALTLTDSDRSAVSEGYSVPQIKKSRVYYEASVLVCTFQNPDGRPLSVEFRVSDHDVAYRYSIPRVRGRGGSRIGIRVLEELSAFRFPEGTKTFLTPQSDAMIGFARSKPSYEEYYTLEAPMDTVSEYGHGYTFPCLFKVAGGTWALVSETGVDSRYCASHLSDWSAADGYRIAFPMPEENNGIGTVEPAVTLPAQTPWRTLTVGTDLAPIAETTVAWDVVKPRYTTEHQYRFGRSTWSWIVWGDPSINWDDLVAYIDLAHDMGYEYTLIDAYWDANLGRDRMEQLVRYARSRGVDVFLWYSSSGPWNDIPQSPRNIMGEAIARKQEMRWMESIGVKGIKVDFFGGDKQETMRLYEDILSDADDHGLMVIFHGCTLPRGWERMYPNFVGSEAVRASENMMFGQRDNDLEPTTATLHPFVRNTVASMEFGGCFMNRRLHRSNRTGPTRVTTDVFQLATTVLYQNPIQNFALAPNNLTDAPAVCLDFLRGVPTTWDEMRLIDGYPGRFTVLARRSGDTWYVAAANGTLGEPLTVDVADLLKKLGKENYGQLDIYTGGNQPVVTHAVPKKAPRIAAKDALVLVVR